MACTHQNTLLYFYWHAVKQCEACGKKISDGAYSCLQCKDVWFHESCAASKLFHVPDEIIHPLHSHHKLQLNLTCIWTFVCDKCLYISEGPRYYCSSSLCIFSLHLSCALSSVNDPPEDEHRKNKKEVRHYSHEHILKLFKYRKTKEEHYCYWCEKHFSDYDIGCGCISCEFFVHEVCINSIPRKLNHPFHPSHPLRLHLDNRDNHCNACNESIYSMKPYYGCLTCVFRLDFACSKLVPTLELKSHDDHLLTHFKKIGSGYGSERECQCNVCHMRCYADSYCCVQCNFNIHLKCLPFSSSVKHKYHRHPLNLVNSVKEDDSDEYYCDVCEKERNPKHPVYWCEKCKFIVHIECIVLQEEKPSSVRQSMDISNALMTGMELEDDIHTTQQLLIQPLIHEHPMKLLEVTENSEGNRLYCNGCRLVLSGPSYICTRCPEHRVQQPPAHQKNYYLHEKCAKLPYEIIQNPFHPDHPLYFYPKHPAITGEIIVACEECREICLGFIYICEGCSFKLDVKCAFATTVSQPKLNQMEERVTELHHFNHPHKLILGNYTDPIRKIKCSICYVPIFCSVYFCGMCSYICHESCLGLPQKLMHVPFHPDHSFVLHRFVPDTLELRCYACGLPYEFLEEKSAYSCQECNDVKLHCICANSLRRPLKYDQSHHPHHLYYFGENCQLLFADYKHRFLCNKCKERCRGRPFFRCLQCGINFHLECIHIPHVVKSRYHLHPLKLKDSFIEDGSGEYFCDICEEERFGEDHVYCCEECDDRFVAHVECVLAKVEEVISYLVPRYRGRKKPRINVDTSSESSDSESSDSIYDKF